MKLSKQIEGFCVSDFSGVKIDTKKDIGNFKVWCSVLGVVGGGKMHMICIGSITDFLDVKNIA